MSKEVRGHGEPIRWSDAVRRRHPDMSPAEVAQLGEKLDRFQKKAYASGYDLIAVKLDENGDLDIKAPLIVERGLES